MEPKDAGLNIQHCRYSMPKTGRAVQQCSCLCLHGHCCTIECVGGNGLSDKCHGAAPALETCSFTKYNENSFGEESMEYTRADYASSTVCLPCCYLTLGPKSTTDAFVRTVCTLTIGFLHISTITTVYLMVQQEHGPCVHALNCTAAETWVCRE